MSAHAIAIEQEVCIEAGGLELEGHVTIPDSAVGLVIFAHGSGSSRFSPRNRAVADALHEGGLATLLFDLLSAEESRIDMATGHLRFDIRLLARRLVCAVKWAGREGHTTGLRIGLFGASTGAAAALVAAAELPQKVGAVVSRGGRPDMAGEALPRVEAPTLLIIGSLDVAVIDLNEQAGSRLACEHRIEIVPNASHLFEEPGKIEQVAELARQWFGRHLPR